MTLYFLAFLLFSVGLYGLLIKRNLIKIIISLAVMKYAVNIFFVLLGYQRGAAAPLVAPHSPEKAMVNPLLQSLTLNAILIGFALIVLMVVLAIRLYAAYGTFDIMRIRRLRG